MKLLLDTHTFLWAVDGAGMSTTAARAFLDPNNELYLSVCSFWEICIKASLGKLVLAEDWSQRFDVEMKVNRIQSLAIEKTHCQRILSLPFLHGDPFDRLLIAQALCEEMTLLTSDGKIRLYPVQTLW